MTNANADSFATAIENDAEIFCIYCYEILSHEEARSLKEQEESRISQRIQESRERPQRQQVQKGQLEKPQEAPQEAGLGRAGAAPLPLSNLTAGLRGLLDFFHAAGIHAAVKSGDRLFLGNKPAGQTPRLPEAVEPWSPVWRDAVDQITWQYARRTFAMAVKEYGAWDDSLSTVPEDGENGFMIMRGGEQVALIRATRSAVPGHAPVIGNFLTKGAHWDQVARGLRGAHVKVPVSGNDTEPNTPLIRHIDNFPGHLASELTDACMEASRRIRLERQLAYDRSIILDSDLGELTLLPISGTPPQLRFPFTFRIRHHPGRMCVRGELLLGRSDPLPLAIGVGVSEADAITAWTHALLGIADAMCISYASVAARDPVGYQSGHPGHTTSGRRSEQWIPNSRRSWPAHLQPVGPWVRYGGSLVAAHRRHLDHGQSASDEATERARQVGIFLKPHETWVQAHARGIPSGIEMRFRWQAPKLLTSFCPSRQ